MVKQTTLARGKKWVGVRDKAIFENRNKDIEWMNKQAAIVSDIKAYEDSITPVEEPVTKSKKKE